MKYLLVGLLILTIIFSLTGCKESTNEEVYYDIQKSFNNLESYQCIANITIKNNDYISSYKAKHTYKKPDKYRIEILNPQESNGLTTVYNGNNAWLYHPKINQSILIKDLKDGFDKNMFIGYFLKLSLTGEYTEINSDVIDNRDYLVISVEIPGNNMYRKSEQIWISKDKFTPYKLVIYNQKHQPTIEVMYSDFQYNAKLDNDKFLIKK